MPRDLGREKIGQKIRCLKHRRRKKRKRKRLKLGNVLIYSGSDRSRMVRSPILSSLLNPLLPLEARNLGLSKFARRREKIGLNL